MCEQVHIPNDLGKDRYISGKAALNLPTPEGTSGDWHFLKMNPAGIPVSSVLGGMRNL